MPSSGAKAKLSFPKPVPVRLPGLLRFCVYVLFLMVGFGAIPVQRLNGSGLEDEICNIISIVIGVCQASLSFLPPLRTPVDLAFSFLRYLTALVMDWTGGYLTDQASVYCVAGAVLLVIHTLIPVFTARFFLWLFSRVCGWMVSIFQGFRNFFKGLAPGGGPGTTPGSDVNQDTPRSGLTPALLKEINNNYKQLRYRSRVTQPNRSYLRVQRLNPGTKEPVTDEIRDWDIHNEITLSDASGGDKILIKLEPNGTGAYISLPGGGRVALEYERVKTLHGGAGVQPYALTWFGGERP